MISKLPILPTIEEKLHDKLAENVGSELQEKPEKKVDILGLSLDELKKMVHDSLDLSHYRGQQLYRWIYRHRVTSFAEMTNLSKQLRDVFTAGFYVSRPEPSQILDSKDGSRKYLFKLVDGSLIESVLICQPKRYTLCVSSQVGCAIGCKFCRTGLMGLKRNLSAGEILGQVLAVQDDVIARGEAHLDHGSVPFQNIVFMGMGEPLHNKEAVIKAVTILNDEQGCNFSGRKITVSTSGLVPAIEAFGNSEAKANLAISLNATTDEVREMIMPINRKYPLASLLGALKRYPLRNGKRITFEYVMLRGVNDTAADLKRLPELLRDIPSKVNLIPYNDNAGLGFKSPEPENVFRWQKSLLAAGVNSTIRWSKGDDINAACGQLATDYEKKTKASKRASA